ncbi:MAG: hypothetical protein WKG03_10655 [Telluria sp.]
MAKLFSRYFMLPLLFLALCGCSNDKILQKLASPEEQSTAKHYLELLRHKKFTEIEKAADASIDVPGMRGSLVEMYDLIPPGEPTSVKLIGVHRSTVNGVSMLELTFEYAFLEKRIWMESTVKTDGGKQTLIGLSVDPQPASVEKSANRTLRGIVVV